MTVSFTSGKRANQYYLEITGSGDDFTAACNSAGNPPDSTTYSEGEFTKTYIKSQIIIKQKIRKLAEDNCIDDKTQYKLLFNIGIDLERPGR